MRLLILSRRVCNEVVLLSQELVLGLVLLELLLICSSKSHNRLQSSLILTIPRQEGFHAFYKGITPRIMRVAPGQAVTFTVYEFLKDKMERSNLSLVGGKYEE